MLGYMVAWSLHEVIEPICTLIVFGYLGWKGAKLCVRRFSIR